MDSLWTVLLLVMFVACAVAGGWLGDMKGRTGEGIALGILFGVFGLVAAAAMPPSAAKRQEWAEEANRQLANFLRNDAKADDEARVRAAQEAMRRDTTLMANDDRDTVLRLCEATDVILADQERLGLWKSASGRLREEDARAIADADGLRRAAEAEARRAAVNESEPASSTAGAGPDPLKPWLIGTLVVAVIALVALVVVFFQMI